MTNPTLNTNDLNNSNTIATRTKRVATGPVVINESHLFNDADARERMRTLNNDIYQSVKHEESKPKRNYLKILLTSLAIVLTAMGIKKIYNIIKKK